MDIDMISIGNRIKNRRKELNLTQIDIKRECGISSGALSEMENGNRTPSVITFYSLCQALNCSIDWLVTGISPNTEPYNISPCEELLLNGFRELPEEDQSELIEILEIKVRKTQKLKKNSAKSSQSIENELNNKVG